jgi:serine/threonine protein kinase
MDAGAVHGEGNKGRVIDYGTITKDIDSLEYTNLHDVKEIKLYIITGEHVVESIKGPEFLDELLQLDNRQKYVVKEFMIPSIKDRAMGHTKHSYMMREIAGFKHVLPLVKRHKIIGMPYKKYILVGFEIIMKEKGIIYDGTFSRCFVINRKCSQTMSETIVNQFTEKQFVQFVFDILHILIDIQKIDIAHGDIKLDNIMKCDNKYELIDWEYNRPLEYIFLTKHRYLGLSPIYFKIVYGSSWYPAFKLSWMKFFKETGGYDTHIHSTYMNNITTYYKQLMDNATTEEVFEMTKYSLDLCAFGMILYGIMLRNPKIKKSHHVFIMNVFKMDNAEMALRLFRSNKTKKHK